VNISDLDRSLQEAKNGIREKIYFDPPYRHYEGPKRIGGIEAKNPKSREFLTLLSEVTFRVVPKHKLMLKVIYEWLEKKRHFDEKVVQSFSECLVNYTFKSILEVIVVDIYSVP
jgi:hypothetical protein